MTTPDILFIGSCVLAIIIVIVFTFVSVFIYKREQVIKSPYYHCDDNWVCCAPGNSGCDVSGTTGLTGTAKISTNWKQGSDYHQNCVLPIQNAILNYESTPNVGFNFTYLYEGGAIPANNPSVYYPGCTGPGGTGVCGDKTLNPQYEVGSTGLVCPYVSFDAPPGSTYKGGNGILPSGTTSYNTGSTLNTSGWINNPASVYIAGTSNGTNQPGNNYIFPFNTKSKQSYKGQYTGGANNNFPGSNSQKNSFYNLTNSSAYPLPPNT